MKKTALLSISIISIVIFTMSMAAAHTKNMHLSGTETEPCSVTINQDLDFTIPNAIYDAGPLVGKTALKLDFEYFGEQNGQLMWKLGDIGTPSSSSCSVSIAHDMSFTLTDAVYDAGSLVGQMTLQADFEYSGEQAGSLLWYLADLKVDNDPDENPIEVDIDTATFPTETDFDASGDAYNFIDDAVVSNYAVIENFSADDTISFVNADVNDYAFSNEGEDVTLSYNYNDEGTMNVIELTGVVSSVALVYDLASFTDAAGFYAFRR